jgi:hypothetical protein
MPDRDIAPVVDSDTPYLGSKSLIVENQLVPDPAGEFVSGVSSTCFSTIAFLVAFACGIVLLFSSLSLEW